MPAQSETTAVFPPETSHAHRMPKWDAPENIVITGLSGKFPESDNVNELWDNLMNKVDMVTDDERRWQRGLFGLPSRMGKLNDLSKFDSTFFGVHPKQAHYMDPQLRILLETTYEAIVDAGYDPAELHGTKTGVFVGVCSSESNDFYSSDLTECNGYGLTGCSFSMFANRISYTYNFTGPSFSMDTACSSSLFAMQQAVLAIRSNQCDAAIVCGANLCLRPSTSIHFYKLSMLGPDGTCKPFDISANGYCRSETVGVAFLQRESQARRIYASVTHIKTNTDGAKDEGITFPSEKMQKQLMEAVYEEAKVNPLDVCYVEAHGTGTKAGDPVETSAIANVFCKNRSRPLLIGSVKSNIGHAEPASGIGAIAKMVMSIKEGIIPPTIHYSVPNPDIKPLMEGKVKVVTEPTPMDSDYVGLNSFGFGGVNVHVLLKSPTIRSSLKNEEQSSLPRLVLCCDRAEDGVSSMLKYLENTNAPVETYSFLQNLSKRSSMTYRGYTLLRKGPQKISGEIKKVSMEKRPVWFIFSGMGTQWPGMGKDLLQLKPFAKSIYRSVEVLKPHGIDLMSILTKVGNEQKGKREIISSFVAIAAIQVALVDTLSELGITPDGIIGHSVGELGCAYADGCFTAEQMVLSAYWRGKCVEEANLIAGSMAAVGMTWEETKQKCPDGILAACHNSEDTVTVSGPVNKIASFIDQLNSENIFVREVDSCGYAFHSSYINPAAPGLQKALEKIIPNPKVRSPRWISSSIPESSWNSSLAKYCSASYMVNNLVSPVLFREALLNIPSDAIVIEIAPHCLLQAILKRALSANCISVGVMNKKEANNLEFFLSSVGKMYNSGLNPAIEKLYPKISFPVPKNVPTISPFIKWDHSQTWKVALWKDHPSLAPSSEFVVEIDISSPDSADYFIAGHCINGRVLFPATGYLVLAWKALAKHKGKVFNQMPVEFENYSIHRATILSKAGITRFLVNLMHISGDFEICEGGTVAASGKIKEIEEVVISTNSFPKPDPTALKLESKDLYKELRLRGYDYGPTFQGLLEAESSGSHAKVKWDGNWEAFLDAMLQISVLANPTRALFLPTRIQNVKIDPKILTQSEIEKGVDVFYDKFVNECASAGILLKGLKASLARRRQDPNPPLLEEYQFIPYNERDILDKSHKILVQEYTEVCSALARKILEANGKNKAQISDVMNGFKEASDKVLQDYLTSSKENFVLLNSLKEISQLPPSANLQENVKNIVKQLQLNIGNDLLSSTLLSERILRTTLDLVVENLLSSKVKILEISTTNSISKQVQHFLLDFNVLLNTDYTVACPNPDVFDEKIKTVQWDLISSPPSQFSNFDLVVAKDICTNQNFQQLIEHMSSFVKENGFILLIQRTELTPAEKFLSAVGGLILPTKSQDEIGNLIQAMGLTLICKKDDGMVSTMYLLRKLVKDQESALKTVHVIDRNYSWVEKLKDALYKKDSESATVWLIAEDCTTNGIIGLVNCIRREGGGDRIRCVFNATKHKKSLPPFNFKDSVYKELLHNDLIMNVYKDGQWGSFRHISLHTGQSVMTEHAFVNVLTRGDLSSLRWIESPIKYQKSLSKPAGNERLCHVYYAPLNFRDIMLATGKLPPDAIPGDLATQDCILGLEFAGRDENGNRVMGLVEARGLATTVMIDPSFLWAVPDHWTLEEASTVPVAYSTAYYALITRGNLQEGEKVLIHSGSGGVGQAAIAIALSMKCKVYTTVGSVEKRNFLKQRFPQLTDHNFCNSRDLSFEQHILRATSGKGVDVVLNSLAEEKLQASVRCLAQHGRFLEIGKYDLSSNNALGMAIFLKNVSFHGILLDALFENNVHNKAKLNVVQLVTDGIKTGVVQPLKTAVYDQNKIEEAFRFMASGRHIGKVVIKIREEEHQSRIAPKPMKLAAVRRTICHPNKVYILCGGLGGFGLELAAWLITRGARHMVLTSRSGAKTGYQHLRLKYWKDQGIDVVVSNLDASDYSQAIKLIEGAKKTGPIGGIFNLAAVLSDALLENLSEDDYKKVAVPKVDSTYNLDSVSRKVCSDLDWFVTFSSVSCGRGNAGQSNYGYANSVMERICEERTRDGFPGLAIQWGAIGDVGLIIETMGGNETVIGGTLPQRINSCMSVLDIFLQQNHAVVSSIVPAERKSKKKDGASKKDLLQSIAHILGIQDTTTMDAAITLGELGMDSLMGVEVKQTLERDYDIMLSMQDIRMLSLKQLEELGSQSEGEAVQTKKTSNVVKPTKDLTCKYLMPKDCIVKMNDVKEGSPIFMIHSIEGVITNLTSIAKELPYPVYGFQSTSDVPQSSCRDMALYYCDLIKTKLQPEGPYHILGYSFGSAIAFEIVTELQRRNEKVRKLFFLDGSPALVTSYTKKHETRLNSDAMKEAEGMFSFIQQYVDVSDKMQLIQTLVSFPSMKERRQHAASVLASLTEFKDRNDVILAAESYFNKLICANEYKCSEKFKGNAILVKASESLFVNSQLGEDFGASKFCDGKITVHTVEGNHTSFLQGKSGSQVTSIITQEMKQV
uniref:Fatty acid synthase n=1 Tax=Hadrurus spadix TaxID=141984 RepID=A0A1W7RAJ9_9SCOR